MGPEHPHGGDPDPRGVDAVFRELLSQEGFEVSDGKAPIEPQADDRPDPSHDEVPPVPSWQSRRLHPAGGMARKDRNDPMDRAFLDAEDPFLEDFRAPDPELPAIERRAAAPWALLLGGLLLALAAAFSQLPSLLALLGALTAAVGLLWLLSRTPRSPRHRGDGAQV